MSSEDRPWFKSWPSYLPRNLEKYAIPLQELLVQSARKYPKQVAIVFANKEITYNELNLASDSFATNLRALNIKRGDCVALLLPNLPQFLIAYYGILKAGAVFTAISPMHREREVECHLRDSEAKTIITLDSLFPIIKAVWPRTMLRTVVLTSIEEYASPSPASIPISQNPNVFTFQDFLKSDATLFNLSINPAEDLAALQYTGGTTGTAKAAMLTHRNLVSNAIAFGSWINGKKTKETFLTALPLFHIYGMTTSLNVPISLGAKMVLLPRFEPTKALEIIQKHKVTVFCGVPTMYQTLTASPELGQYDLTSIRVCISGASPLPPQVQKKFMEVTGGLLAEGYGLTEASPVTHCNPVDQTMRTVKVGSIGLPLPDTDAKIVDIETGEKTLSVGEIGELAIKGPQVMKGYWRQSQETTLVFRGDWLLTGDIARMDPEGYFFIVDRKKDLIKYKDYSVYPREIEDVLYEHPAIKLCAVIGKPDLIAGEVPKAFIVLKEGKAISGKEIADFANGKIASYKAIREIELRKDLPLSSAGKVLRRVLSQEEKTKASTS
jgi:long-chain acyl-CoA synthetase